MKDIIHQKRKEYCDLIREYSMSQCSIWQKLPYLKLCSYGVSGYHDGDVTFFRTGFFNLAIRIGVNDYQNVFIDCETGEIHNKHNTNFTPIDDETLVKLPPKHFDALLYVKNAQYWIDYAKNELAEKGTWADHDLELPTCNHQEKYFRWKIAKDFNITPVYKRVKK
jgi:hypothetical protein